MQEVSPFCLDFFFIQWKGKILLTRETLLRNLSQNFIKHTHTPHKLKFHRHSYMRDYKRKRRLQINSFLEMHIRQGGCYIMMMNS